MSGNTGSSTIALNVITVRLFIMMLVVTNYHAIKINITYWREVHNLYNMFVWQTSEFLTSFSIPNFSRKGEK